LIVSRGGPAEGSNRIETQPLLPSPYPIGVAFGSASTAARVTGSLTPTETSPSCRPR